MALHDKLANKAIRSGKRASDFNTAAHQHAKASWFFIIAAGAIWYFFGWKWALVPGALGILSLFQSISAAMIAERIEIVWQKTSGVNTIEIPNDVMSIIEAYRKTLINSAPTPGCVADVSKLPYPKQKIKAALISVLKIVEDQKIREQLKIAYILLKDWQEGVGESNQGLDLSKIDLNQNAEALATAISNQSIGEKDWGKITLEEQKNLVHELQELGLWDNMVSAEKIAEIDVKKQGITIEAFKQVIKLEPDDAEAHYNLGVAYGKSDRSQEAIETYKQAIKLKPDYAKAYYNLGVAYFDLGRYQDAIEAYKQAVKLEPDDAEAHNNLGGAYDELGRYEEAIEAYKQAIWLKPDYVKAHYNLGNAYRKSGHWQEAIEAFKQAIRLEPDFAEAHYNLGIAYEKSSRFKEAIEAYKQAIKLKPDDAGAHNNLGNVYGKLGRYQEAIEAFKQTIRLKPGFVEAHINLGITYKNLGRYQDAIEAFKQAIRLNSDYAQAHFNLGYAYLKIGDKGNALEEYKILKTLNPELANKLLNSMSAEYNEQKSKLNEDTPKWFKGDKIQVLRQPHIYKAMKTYPQARDRFLQGLPIGYDFFVTVDFHDKHVHENAFIIVRRIINGQITGVVATKLLNIKSHFYGQEVTFAESEVIDWTITSPDGKEEGNFIGKFLDESH